jgi:hypothetical protein
MGAEYFCVEVVFSLKERVAAEVRVNHGCYWSVVGGSTCRVLFIIFILTASALRSRETPPATIPISFGCFCREGDWFSVEHDCPG